MGTMANDQAANAPESVLKQQRLESGSFYSIHPLMTLVSQLPNSFPALIDLGFNPPNDIIRMLSQRPDRLGQSSMGIPLSIRHSLINPPLIFPTRHRPRFQHPERTSYSRPNLSKCATWKDQCSLRYTATLSNLVVWNVRTRLIFRT